MVRKNGVYTISENLNQYQRGKASGGFRLLMKSPYEQRANVRHGGPFECGKTIAQPPACGCRVPMRKSGCTMNAENKSREQLISELDTLRRRVAAQESLEVEHKRIEEKLRQAVRQEHRNIKRLVQASDHERQLIAKQIHEGLAQQLAGALMHFYAFVYLKNKKPRKAAKAYDTGISMLQQGQCATRSLLASVRSPTLDMSGIVEAVAHLVHEEDRKNGPKVYFHCNVTFDRLDSNLENAIYRITQEALANACQHSKSEKVRVRLVQRKDLTRIEVRDWGVGFCTKLARERSFGLEGIRQRVRLLGGECSIRSAAGKGTRVTVELPVIERKTE